MAVTEVNSDHMIVTADIGAASFDRSGLSLSPRVKPDGGLLPPMVSYAQNFEDVMLRRALQDIERGFYVDIGAAHPSLDSVTRWFYENGWRGVNVEPDPRYFEVLEAYRAEDINLQCLVGASSGNTIFSLTSVGGLSTGSGARLNEINHTAHLGTKTVVTPCVTIDQLFAVRCDREVDFLKIDAEGMEDDILRCAKFTEHRPRIVVVEATRANSQISNHESWEPLLTQNGYLAAWFDGLNRFYVRSEDEWRLEFFKVAPCYFDNFFSSTIEARVGAALEEANDSHQGEIAGFTLALSELTALKDDMEARVAASGAENMRLAHEYGVKATQAAADLSQALGEVSEAMQRASAAEARADSTSQHLAVIEAKLHEAEREAAQALERQSVAESHANDADERLAVIELKLLRAEREAAEALRREQAAEAEVLKFKKDLAEAQARAQEILSNQPEMPDVASAERIEVLEAALVRAKRDAAAALRREQAAEAEAVEVMRRANMAKSSAAPTPALQGEARNPAATVAAPTVVAAVPERVLPAAGDIALADQWRSYRLLRSARRFARANDWATAETNYAAIVKLQRNKSSLWVQYGHSLKQQGKLSQAEAAYRAATAVDPSAADAYLHLGHALASQGSISAATEAFSEAFRLKPSAPEARSSLCSIGVSREQLIEILLPDGGAPPQGRAYAGKGVSGPIGLLRLRNARAAARKRNWETAALGYLRLARSFPDAVSVWVQLGHAFKEQGRLEEAEGAYFESIRRDPRNLDTLRLVGDLMGRQGAYEAAGLISRKAFALMRAPAAR